MEAERKWFPLNPLECQHNFRWPAHTLDPCFGIDGHREARARRVTSVGHNIRESIFLTSLQRVENSHITKTLLCNFCQAAHMAHGDKITNHPPNAKKKQKVFFQSLLAMQIEANETEIQLKFYVSD
jgi:hypothetical protein